MQRCVFFLRRWGANDRRSEVASFTSRLYVLAGNDLQQTAYETQLSFEKLHVIFTERHNWLKHSAHNLKHTLHFFNSTQLVQTQNFFILLQFLLLLSCNLFIHRDFMLEGLPLPHNLQWHSVYAEMPRDFFQECCTC